MVVTATTTRTDIRVYLLVEDLQRQFAAYLGTPTRARGYPPYEGEHAPRLTMVDVQMIGAAGKLYIGGNLKDVTTARDRITEVLAGIEGREH